jgi:PAS domain S-box-containing protein
MKGDRILVVDDDDDYCQLMVGHLVRRGYEVDHAADGEAGLRTLEANGPYAVLVTDLMMPGITGIELLRKAKEHDPALEAIVVSGAGTLESAISSMRQSGAFDYLPKPLDKISDLSLAVERASEYRRLRLEREQLLAQVTAERERLRSVVAHAGDAILAADAEGVVIAANPAACHLLGQETLVGLEAWTRLPPPLAVLLAHWQAFEGQRPAVTEVPYPGDAVQMVSLTSIPRSEAEQGGGWVMVLRDITHLKRLDEITLRLLTEAASRIRNPLTQAFSTVVELNELPEVQADSRATERVDRLMTQLGSIRRWTEDLMTLVQIEAGAGATPQPVDFAALVREWMDSASADQARQTGVVPKVEIEERVPYVHADRELVRKLLEQLVSQATWRSEPGRELGLRVRYNQEQVWLEVSDEGEVISEADMPHLFEKVFVESRGRFGPTGLELAMAKAIVDKTGGQMWVRRHEPRGNTFAVSYPPLG